MTWKCNFQLEQFILWIYIACASVQNRFLKNIWASAYLICLLFIYAFYLLFHKLYLFIKYIISVSNKVAAFLITARLATMAPGRPRMISTSEAGTAHRVVEGGLVETVSVSYLVLYIIILIHDIYLYCFLLSQIFKSFHIHTLFANFSMRRSYTETTWSCDFRKLSNQCQMWMDTTSRPRSINGTQVSTVKS